MLEVLKAIAREVSAMVVMALSDMESICTSVALSWQGEVMMVAAGTNMVIASHKSSRGRGVEGGDGIETVVVVVYVGIWTSA